MKKQRRNFSSAVCATLVSFGPVGWFFIDYFSKRYDRLPSLFLWSIALTILSTVVWVLAIQRRY